ncbi:MAG: ribosome maturation factor RimP [Paenisporosarcina sp.]
MSKIIIEVEKLVKPIVEELNLELVDMEYLKEGRDWFLRIYIDTPQGGIDIEQCALVSERVSEILDANDPIEQNYFLEVSSPGAERPLKEERDFEKAVGQYIHVKTYAAVTELKENEFEGYLLSYSPEGLEIEVRVKTRKIKVHLTREKIAFARLAIKL